MTRADADAAADAAARRVELVSADIGGTHARFALASVEQGRVTSLGEPLTLRTAEYASLQTAWEAFARHVGRALPANAALAVAAPIRGSQLKLTNNPWMLRPAELPGDLQLQRLTLVNDFGAVAHAVQHVGAAELAPLFGPRDVWPADGVITVIGPGTGLGVAMVLRRAGSYQVVETEGGHTDFAALDTLEDAILARLRRQYTRVSVERVCAGPGLAAIYRTLADIEGRPAIAFDDAALWQRALTREDSLAAAAFDRFCLCLGAAAGDFALAQGATAVVIAGGLGQRIAPQLERSGFYERFVAKGRFQRMMETIPVRLIQHPQPGLFGAAAAFAQEHAS